MDVSETGLLVIRFTCRDFFMNGYDVQQPGRMPSLKDVSNKFFSFHVVLCVMLGFYFFVSISLCFVDCVLHVFFGSCAFTDSVSGLWSFC